MPVWKSISKAFSNLWNKFSNQNANSTHTVSFEDKSDKRSTHVSPSEGDRQSNLWPSSNEDQKQTKRAQTGEFSWPYREEIVHSRGPPVLASQSKPPPIYSPYDRIDLFQSPHEELTQPTRSAISRAPEISPRPAYSSNCGLQTSVASSGRESPHFPAAVARKATPLPVSSVQLEQKPRPTVVPLRKENVQPKQVSPTTTAQVNDKSTTLDLRAQRYLQERGEGLALRRVAVEHQAYTINTPQPQIGRSLTTSERSRRSLAETERALPSPIPATRRSSASELVSEGNRIRMSQLQSLNKHINSFYVKNLHKYQGNVDVEDDFSYRNSCLPYKPDLVNIWFRAVVNRHPAAEPEGIPHRGYVDMINLMKTSDSRTMLTAVAKFRTIRLEEGEELYFHATDAQSAKSILESGIDLTKSRDKEDFSNGYGFYVTTDYTTSVDWANRKGGKFCHSTGAIIAFKISRQLQKEQVHLFLEANTAEGRRKWEKTVSHFRNGEAIGALSVMLKNVKFIRGPVSKNAFLRPGEVPVPYDFTQICICDEEYATRYGSLRNICFVIFLKVS